MTPQLSGRAAATSCFSGLKATWSSDARVWLLGAVAVPGA